MGVNTLDTIWEVVGGYEYRKPKTYEFKSLTDLFMYMANQAQTIGSEYGDEEEEKEAFFKAANFILDLIEKAMEEGRDE